MQLSPLASDATCAEVADTRLPRPGDMEPEMDAEKVKCGKANQKPGRPAWPNLEYIPLQPFDFRLENP